MKVKTFLAAGLLGAAMLFADAANACTNFLFTKGATKDGSTMITYAADSHTLYGELYYRRAANYPAGTMFQVIDWDSGTPLIQIPQVAHTYSVVGNMNECQLAIGETTYGGREELAHEIEGGIDYGSLIYLTLQRARNAREAILTLAGFLSTYPYHSEGESFSICDPNEVWIFELIGKRPGLNKADLSSAVTPTRPASPSFPRRARNSRKQKAKVCTASSAAPTSTTCSSPKWNASTAAMSSPMPVPVAGSMETTRSSRLPTPTLR